MVTMEAQKVRKVFIVSPEVGATWDNLSPTVGASSESAAFAQFVFGLDEELREKLDAEALALYERGKLSRTERVKAIERFRARQAAQSEFAAA
jgi:hypothetical protein